MFISEVMFPLGGQPIFDPLEGTDCEEGQLKARAAPEEGQYQCHATEWVVDRRLLAP